MSGNRKLMWGLALVASTLAMQASAQERTLSAVGDTRAEAEGKALQYVSGDDVIASRTNSCSQHSTGQWECSATAAYRSSSTPAPRENNTYYPPANTYNPPANNYQSAPVYRQSSNTSAAGIR